MLKKTTIPLLFFFLILSLFCSCAAVGTKTLYKNNVGHHLERIGFNQLGNDNETYEIFPQTNKIYATTIFETFSEYGIDDVEELSSTDIEFDHPNIDRIIEICEEHDLDGLLISKIKFIHVTYTVFYVPVAKNYDTEVEMKLFSKNGNIILSTKHNTLKGNSYMMPPPADRTIGDGTKGALRRITKELGLKKIKL